MPVDPALAPFLPMPAIPVDVDIPQWRAAAEAQEPLLAAQLVEPGPETVRRRVVGIPVGDEQIEVVVYRPDLDGPLPVHIYLHGGGWVAGSAISEVVDATARERAEGASCVVVAVNYRKAPEHPFPTPLLDCEAAFRWVLSHADELGVDAGVITMGGASAGANLVAALALRLRDAGGPLVALQLLEVPTLDLSLGLPSHADSELGSAYTLARSDMELFIRLYLGEGGDVHDPYVSPLLASDLSGLPPAHIMSAEFDMLRDDGARYADRLRAAGVPAHFSPGLGHVHASGSFTRLLPSARDWRDEAVAALRRAHLAMAATNGRNPE